MNRTASVIVRLTVVFAIFLGVLAVGDAMPADAAVTRGFAPRFTTNTSGAIVMAGNTSLACPTTATGCTAAKSASSANTTGNTSLDNNSYTMANVDVDTDPTTFNSSAATLTVPTDSRILFAGLYWGADTTAGANGAVPPSAANRDRVQFRTPGSNDYETVLATTTDTSPVSGGVRYQGFADVTGAVRENRSGEYLLGNIQAGTGRDRYAGWALVVAYGDAAEPVRNLTVFDGFAVVQQNPATDANVTIPVSGFRTPLKGPVRTRVGVVAYEGDVGIVGDSLRLNSRTVSNSLNPATNSFNSTLTSLGAARLGGRPAQTNTMGLDVDTFQLDGVLANGATSASITLNSSGDTYFPGAVTFSTELYAPHLTIDKSGVDVNGGDAEPGDVVTYTLDVVSDGADNATAVVVNDVVDSQSEYVADTLTIDGVPVTDQVGDDTGEYVASDRRVRARLGANATATTGGNMAIGTTHRITFDVRISDTVTSAPIANTATATYTGATSGTAVNGQSNTVLISTALQSDLEVTHRGPVGPVDVGTDTALRSWVMNRGPSVDTDVVYTATIPPNFVVGSVTTSSGSCTVGATVRCTVAALGVGETVGIVVNGSFGAGLGNVVSTATVTGTNNDRRQSNNIDHADADVNNAPTANDVAGYTPSDTAVTLDVAATGNDIDGDPLIVSNVGTTPAGSVAVVNNEVVFTPVSGFRGDATFTYTLSDNRGGFVTRNVVVTVANAAPQPNPDAVATAGNTAVTVDVLANDTDPNGDDLSVVGVTQPSSGIVTFTDGDVTYTPTAAFQGQVGFEYTVSDGITTASSTVVVNVGGQAPTAQDDDVQTDTSTPVTVDVIGNDTDPNGDDLSVVDVSQPFSGTVTFTGSDVTYTPPAGFAGSENFTYRITDGTNSATATVHVTVRNAAPRANPDVAATDGGQSVSVDVTVNDTDPNGDPITVIGASTMSAAQVSVIDGKVVYFVPENGFKGDDVVVYTISDGAGGTSTSTLTVTVRNAAPVAENITTTIDSDTAASIDPILFAYDGNGDALTIDGVGTARHGSTVADGRTITYTPNAGYKGVDSFTYTITDGDDTSTATVTVTVRNAAPTAAEDTATTTTDTAVTIDVTANDADANSDELRVVSVTAPSDGTADIVDGKVVFTPAAGFKGIATFAYSITDGTDTATANVNVTVANAAPVTAPDSVTTDAKTEVQVDVLANDTDANGDPLTVTSISGQPAGTSVDIVDSSTIRFDPGVAFKGVAELTYTVTDGETSVDGQLRITVGNAAPLAVADTATTATDTPVVVDVLANDTDDNDDELTVTSVDVTGTRGLVRVDGDGTITYTPAQGFKGRDSFTYTITDGAASASATVDIDVANAAPVGNADSTVTSLGTTIEVDVTANDTDANGDALVVTGASIRTGSATVDVVDNRVRVVPTPGFSGPVEVEYVVSDGEDSTLGDLFVLVDNDQPVAVDDHVTTPNATEVAITVLDNDLDPNGDPLTVGNFTQPAAGQGTVTREGDVLTYTPPSASFKGDVTFTYDITDGALSATATVHVTVRNAVPVASDTSTSTPSETAVGVDVGEPAFASDANGDPLGVATATTDDPGSVSVTGTTITYTPAPGFQGVATIVYRLTDGTDVSDKATLTVDVANAAPQTAADEAGVTAGGSVTIDVLANDADPNGDALTVSDATLDDPAAGTLSVSGVEVVFVADPAFKGIATFTYTVSDGTVTSFGTGSITVANADPVAVAHEYDVDGRTPAELSVLDGGTDVNGDELEIVSVTQPRGGTVTFDTDTLTFTPDTDFKGDTTFTYTVSDGETTATATVTVSVRNLAPAALPDTVTTQTDTPVDVFVLGNDTDANGDPLVVETVTEPSNGGVVISSGGTITYTPACGFRGADSFTYTVSDGTDTDTATVNVTVENAAPDAVDDRAVTLFDAAVDIRVLDNDTDPNSDPLDVVSFTQPATGGTVTRLGDVVTFEPTSGFVGDTTFTYTITDGDLADTATVTVTVSPNSYAPMDDTARTPGDTPVDIDVLANDLGVAGRGLNISIVDEPSSGVAALDGTIVEYTPATGFKGDVTFSYTLDDGAVTSGTATVTVTVENVGPSAVDDEATTRTSTPVAIEVLDNDSDRNDDTLTVTDTSNPGNGSVTVDEGVAVYRAHDSFVGTDTFTYTITDGEDSVTATVTVTVDADVTPPTTDPPTDPPTTDPPTNPPVVDPSTPPTTPPTGTDGPGGGSPSTPTTPPTAGPGTGSPGSPGATDGPSGDPLPRTGSDPLVMLRLAALLTALGATVFATTRMRRTARRTPPDS